MVEAAHFTAARRQTCRGDWAWGLPFKGMPSVIDILSAGLRVYPLPVNPAN